MRAVCWMGKQNVSVENVPDPGIVNPHDAIVRVTSTAICGSDLHLYDGYIPTMQQGDILGHEFMGEVVETGPGVKTIKPGDRVVVPFTISCGACWFCRHEMFSACDNTNPNAWMMESAYGQSVAGIYGYSHLLGGYAGGQAEFARVPFADVGLLRIESDVPDDKVLFLSDIFPTGYQAADVCTIRPGDVVAVWGCGPVGQFAIRSALMLGAQTVIAIDHFPARLALAHEAAPAGNGSSVVTIDFERGGRVHEQLMDLTGGRGPDACIEAVGLESHGSSLDALYDRVKVATFMATDRGHALRQAIHACRKGGTLSVPGVFGGVIDKFPIGAVFNKGLTIRTGQTHVQKYMRPLLQRIENGEIDPSFVISHRIALADAPAGYAKFRFDQNGCTKVVMTAQA